MTFPKGVSGNPNGRPKNPVVEALREAIIEYEEKNDVSFLLHCVKRAFVNDDMAKALLKKYAPDLQNTALTDLAGEGIRIIVEDAVYKDEKGECENEKNNNRQEGKDKNI